MLTLKLHFPPNYVLDQMEFYEIRAIMKYEYLAHSESWEQARLVAYMIAKVNSSKKNLKMTDILKFPWENSDGSVKNTGDTSVSNNELERLRKRAEQYINTNTI